MANARPSVLPWAEDADKTRLYRLYGGLASAGELAAASLERPEPELSTYGERRTCLYTLALDGSGHYVPDSFHLAFFPWATGQLLKPEEGEDFPALNPALCEDLNAELDEELRLSNPRFTAAMIEALNQSLERLIFGEEQVFFDKTWFSLTEDPDAVRDLSRMPLVLRELRRAAEQLEPRDALLKYVGGIRRLDNLKTLNPGDPESWKPYLSPDRYVPAGWPAAENPTLSAQTMINRIASEEEKGAIHFYRAPESSDRDVVLAHTLAGQVFKRAEFLASMTKPSDAFTMRRFQQPPNDYSGNYYVPFLQLSKLGMVVSAEDSHCLKRLAASLNDPAFINRSHSHTDSFDLRQHKEIYFTALAKALMPGSLSSWGLGAVYVEDEKALAELVRVLGTALDARSPFWEPYSGSEDRLLSWEEARQRFERLREKVRAKVESLMLVYRQSEEVASVEVERDELEERLGAMDRSLEGDRQALTAAKEAAELARDHAEGRKADERNYTSAMRGFWKWVYHLFKIGPYARGLEDLRVKAEESEKLAVQAEDRLAEEERRLKDLEVKEELLRKQLRLKEKQIEDRLPSTELMRAALGDNYADHRFYREVLGEKSQAACPWMDHELAGLRERMFRAALDLHKSFCVYSNEIRQNFRRLELLLDGQFTEHDEADALPHLLNSLRLVVPLLIMPRAFMSRLERHGAKGEGGTLLYLDPERSAPRDLVGPFWRAARSFCFGDAELMPRYNEPKGGLTDMLRESFALPPCYTDRRYGAADHLLGASGEAYRQGKALLPFALRRENRREDPIFELDNTLSLNKLLLGTPAKAHRYPEDFLDGSSWLDIGSSADERSCFVPFQADILTDMLTAYAEQRSELPDVGIACFYPSVYEGFRRYAEAHWTDDSSLLTGLLEPEELMAWFDAHVFLLSSWNGKAWDELVFLSGCDEDTGDSVLNLFFESSRPLHTLFSAVKRHLLFIGNKEVWAARPPADRVFAALNRDESPVSLGKKTLVFVRAGLSDEEAQGLLPGKTGSGLAAGEKTALEALAGETGRYEKTDRYYTSALKTAGETLALLYPGAKAASEKTAFNEVAYGVMGSSPRQDEETRTFLSAWSGGLETDASAETRAALSERAAAGVRELLDELERLGKQSATVITHEALMKTYYESASGESAEGRTFVSGGGFRVEYHRVGKAWKAGQTSLLPDSLKPEAEVFPEKQAEEDEAKPEDKTATPAETEAAAAEEAQAPSPETSEAGDEAKTPEAEAPEKAEAEESPEAAEPEEEETPKPEEAKEAEQEKEAEQAKEEEQAEAAEEVKPAKTDTP